MADVLAILGQRRKEARVGTVIDVAAGGKATVDVDGAQFFAQLTNQTSTVSAGASVALLPIGDGTTWLVIASLSDGGAVGQVLGSNLVPNPSFEFGLPDGMPSQWGSVWTNGPAVTTWDDTPGVPHSGNGVARVTLTPTADPVATYCYSAPIILDAGVNYRCSSWLRASAIASNTAMAVTIFSAPTAVGAQPFGAGAAQATLASVSLPGAAWQEAYGNFVLPAGHAYASLFLLTTANAGADLTAWWDDAAIRQIITT